MKYDEWMPYQWHCSNCGNIVTGYRNDKGTIKAECGKCRTYMVRKVKSKTCDSIEVFAPKEMQSANRR